MPTRPLLQNSREVVLSSSDSGPILVDSVDNALVAIEFPHHEIHSGNTFISSWKSEDGSDIADNGTFGLYLQVKDKVPHLTFGISCGGDSELEFWEGCSFSVTGTVWPAHNLNRMSATLPTVDVRLNPTLTTGTPLEDLFIPGGTGPVQSGGGTGRRDTEWNLRTGTSYFLQVTNRAGSAQPGGILAQWYEESV